MRLRLFALLFLGQLALSAFAAGKPNILLIYSDDHGWADLGAQGVNGDIRTPNLDQLAREGVRFARGYVSAPQCVPSRAGVITGRYQQKFGVEDNLKGPLPLAEVTIAERLKPAGYLSGFVGKCHLDIGGAKGQAKAARLMTDHMPHHQGFEEYFRGELRQFYASHDLSGKPYADAPHLVTDDRFRVVVQTEAALSFLDRRAARPEQPWFLYLAWYAPHVPLESPEPWFSKIPAHLPKERRQALAMIAAMDEGLGQIRAKLKAMGAEQQTLIFFVGDNGAPVKPGAWDGSINAPLIGEKGMLTDGGTRVPFVAAWPGRIPAGTVFEHPVINLDLAATANALAGLPPDDRLDGVNLMPFLTGENKAAPHDALFWRWRSQAAVLEFPWKLIVLGNHEKFLFNVTKPDGELAANNHLLQHPEIAARLEAKLKAWSASLKPPGPPEPGNDQDDYFHRAHVKQLPDAESTRRGRGAANSEPPGAVQGWVCRNGTLAVKNGALVITPDAGAKGAPFLAQTGLKLTGPVTLTLRARAQSGGKSSASWRTQGDRDFSADKSAAFEWPAGPEWHEIKVTLPVSGSLLHLRLSPAKAASGIEIQWLKLRAQDGREQTWKSTP
jgi:uncharacterized sulfatase